MYTSNQFLDEKDPGLQADMVENVSENSASEIEAPAGRRAWNLTCVFSCVVVGASSVLFGYDDKIVSPVAAMGPFIDHVQGIGQTSVLTARNQQLVFCVPLVGAIVGALLSAPATGKFGRKWPIIVAYTLSLAGTMLQTFSPNLAAFVVGRFFNAILMAVAMTITPLYLSELVPAKHRGKAVTSPNIFNLISGVIGTIIANATHTRPDKTAYMIPIGLQAVMPAVLIPLTAFVPESPLWLMSHGREDEARHNLTRIRNVNSVSIESEFRVMKVTYEKEMELTKGVTFFDLFKGHNFIRTMVAGSMFSVNQVTGIILSTTYATVFLTQLGVGNPFQLTIAASCCTLAGTLLAPLLVDRVGRRPIAMVGMTALLIIDIICGTLAFYMGLPNIPNVVAALSFLFNVFWASSFYALSLTLPAEIPTPRLRNLTSAYTIGASYVTAVLTTVVVPQLTSADAANLGAKAYLVFAGCVAFTLVFYYFYLPETAGRTFAEIDEMYEAGILPRKWKGHVCSATVKETY